MYLAYLHIKKKINNHYKKKKKFHAHYLYIPKLLTVNENHKALCVVRIDDEILKIFHFR